MCCDLDYRGENGVNYNGLVMYSLSELLSKLGEETGVFWCHTFGGECYKLKTKPAGQRGYRYSFVIRT